MTFSYMLMGGYVGYHSASSAAAAAVKSYIAMQSYCPWMETVMYFLLQSTTGLMTKTLIDLLASFATIAVSVYGEYLWQRCGRVSDDPAEPASAAHCRQVQPDPRSQGQVGHMKPHDLHQGQLWHSHVSNIVSNTRPVLINRQDGGTLWYNFFVYICKLMLMKENHEPNILD